MLPSSDPREGGIDSEYILSALGMDIESDWGKKHPHEYSQAVAKIELGIAAYDAKVTNLDGAQHEAVIYTDNMLLMAGLAATEGKGEDLKDVDPDLHSASEAFNEYRHSVGLAGAAAVSESATRRISGRGKSKGGIV